MEAEAKAACIAGSPSTAAGLKGMAAPFAPHTKYNIIAQIYK